MKKFIALLLAVVYLSCIAAVPTAYAEEQPLTLGEMALFLVELFDLEYDSSMAATFADVPEDSPYYEAVCICCHEGLMLPDEEKYIGVDQIADRWDLSNAIYNAGLFPAKPDKLPTDVDEYYDGACAVLAYGIMDTYEDGYFKGFLAAYRSDVNVSALNTAFDPTTAETVNLDLAKGSVEILRNIKGITFFMQGDTVIATSAKAGIIRQTGSATATENTITVTKGDVALSISGLNAAPDSESPISVEGASLTLTLVGTNSFKAPSQCAGIFVPGGAELTIKGSGSLTAEGGYGAAGIGGAYSAGHCGTITVTGGTVTAIGSYTAAGIGNGYADVGGDITISGGSVTAVSDSSGAGIGDYDDAYSYNEGCKITISGGSVTATGGGNGGAGIYSHGGSISISGGSVTATASSDYAYTSYAGIENYGGDISISGGTVTAVGCGHGPGIGGAGSSVAISDARVKAEGYYYAIGGNSDYNSYCCEAITIDDSADVELSYEYDRGTACRELISVNAQPIDSAAHAGNNAAFSVDAYGHSGLSYRWQVSSDNETWSYVEGQTSAHAELPVSAEESFFYRCELTNGWGNTIFTKSARAQVLSFAQQPVSVDTELNDIVSFSVESGCSNVSYRWQRSYDDGNSWSDVNGEVYPTLIINATLSDSSAKYRCLITATNGDTLASDVVGINLDAGGIVTYTVETFRQSADGSGYELYERRVVEGTAGEKVSAPAASYVGFAENEAKGKVSGTVAKDSSLVLSRYFDRITYSISFEMNGGSSIPNISGLYGAEVIRPAAPARYGYTFCGWYADEELEEEFVFDTMPLNGATVYAKWEAIGAGRGIEYLINEIVLRDPESYESLDCIPAGDFLAEISVTNLSAEAADTLVIACYRESGQFAGMYFLYGNLQIGQTMTFGAYVENAAGDIAEIKAFVCPNLGSPIPLAAGKTFG